MNAPRLTTIVFILGNGVACQHSSQLASGDNIGATPQSTGAGNGQHLTGQVYLIAPISHAHVTITRERRGEEEVVAEATTDDKGTFDVTLPQPTDGDLLIEVVGDRGGSTLEPVSGSPISLSEGDRLMTLAINTQLGQQTSVVINPLSTLVAVRALQQFRTGAVLADAYSRNTDLFSSHFQTASLWLAPPMDVTSGEAPGLSSSVLYGLTLVGLSQHAIELGARAGVTDVSIVNALVVLRALVTDVNDGVFDGKKDDKPINIVGNVFIDQETSRLALAKSIDTWLDSSQNKTGLTKRDVSQTTNAIRQDVSELYPAAMPPEQMPDTSQSGAPPMIVITAPTANQTFGVNDNIVGYVEDADGLGTFKLSIDGKQVLVPLDTSSGTKWTFTFLPSVTDGAHVLQVEATDSKTNHANQQVSFSYDSTGPTVALVQCVAPDDRNRATTVTSAGASYADTTGAGACGESDLSSGTQPFYTYADLYEEGTRVPQVQLSVTDASSLSAVTYVVKVNDVVAYGPHPLAAGTGAATHAIVVDQAVLGLPSLGVHASDLVSVEVTAVDKVGNTTMRAFQFHLTLMPTPLYVQETPVDSAVGLSSHTYAANNVQDLFHEAFFSQPSTSICGQYFCQGFPDALVHVTKFAAVNVSPRPIVMSSDWATATIGSMSLQRTAFRSLVFKGTALPLGPNPCAEISEMDDYPEEVSCPSGFCEGAPSYANQTCRSLAGDYKRGRNTETLQFTPMVAIYQQPGNVRVTQTPFTMAPGTQYTMVIGMFNMRTPSYPTALANTAYPPLDRSGVYGGGGYATNAGGFYEVDQYQSHDDSGFIGVRGLIYNYTSSLFSYYRGFIGSDTSYNSSGTARKHLMRSGGSNYLFQPVVFEHSLNFTSTVKWRAPIAMGATEPIFVGTANHQPLGTLSTHQPSTPQPNLCPYSNPLCNVDLSGW